MPIRKFVAGAAISAAAIAGQPAVADHHDAAVGPPHAVVIDANGNRVGTIVLEETPAGLLIKADVEGLPPGEHGFHLHETGVCNAAEKFATAGGHFAPRSNAHGLMDSAGPHAGDMPNQFAAADGKLRAHVLNTQVSLGPGVGSLMDNDGTALVIHAGADDYASQPSGAAGDRLACAVLVPPNDR